MVNGQPPAVRRNQNFILVVRGFWILLILWPSEKGSQNFLTQCSIIISVKEFVTFLAVIVYTFKKFS